MIDADMTYPISEIPKFVKLLDEYEVVIGSRTYIESDAMSATNMFGNYLISHLASILYRNVGDVCTGMWGFRKELYKRIDVKVDGFELEANLFTEIVKGNCTFIEVPITYAKRNGKSKLHLIDGIKICMFLIKERLLC
jgi:dolichol-phosphate mannosyltransferase